MVVTQFATETTTTFGRLKNRKYVSAYFLTFTIIIINESSQESKKFNRLRVWRRFDCFKGWEEQRRHEWLNSSLLTHCLAVTTRRNRTAAAPTLLVTLAFLLLWKVKGLVPFLSFTPTLSHSGQRLKSTPKKWDAPLQKQDKSSVVCNGFTSLTSFLTFRPQPAVVLRC